MLVVCVRAEVRFSRIIPLVTLQADVKALGVFAHELLFFWGVEPVVGPGVDGTAMFSDVRPLVGVKHIQLCILVSIAAWTLGICWCRGEGRTRIQEQSACICGCRRWYVRFVCTGPGQLSSPIR